MMTLDNLVLTVLFLVAFIGLVSTAGFGFTLPDLKRPPATYGGLLARYLLIGLPPILLAVILYRWLARPRCYACNGACVGHRKRDSFRTWYMLPFSEDREYQAYEEWCDKVTPVTVES